MSFDLLPVELLHRVLSFLPLSSVFRLGATSRHFHALIHRDERLWRARLNKRCRIDVADDDKGRGDGCHYPGPCTALVSDPSLSGAKELFLLHSDEFKAAYFASRANSDRARGENLGRLFWSWLPAFVQNKMRKPSAACFPDPTDQPFRLALFGPGIESTNTKHLVHKVVNSHTSLFDAVSFVSGLPGGFGSGVRIAFRQNCATFDLTCLYTNSARVREVQRGIDRLTVANNRLLAQTDDEDSPKLHENVLKLLPTLDALVFAVDSTQLRNLDAAERTKELSYIKSELALMLDGLNSIEHRYLPILVLSCLMDPGENNDFGSRELAHHLNLRENRSRPWAVYEVNICDMNGMAMSLDWVLYHCQKRKNNLEFHTQNSINNSL